MYMGMCTYLTKPSTTNRMWPIFKQNTVGLNSEFSFSNIDCFTMARVPNQLYYLPIAVGLREQMVSCLSQEHLYKVKDKKTFSWIWTWVNGSISCNVLLHVCLSVSILTLFFFILFHYFIFILFRYFFHC